MTSVLGLPLGDAAEMLKAAGYQVKTVEVRSKKGVPGGNDLRVIRQIETNPQEVTLCYAVFRTEPNEDNA